MRRLRSSEILIVAYFFYVALVALFLMANSWRAWALAAAVSAALLFLTHANGHVRDWVPLAATLIAFREMDWFARPADHHLEQIWLSWDRTVLVYSRGFIESVRGPAFLELCYLLVYAVAPVALWVLLAHGRRNQVNRFWLGYLAGTLGAYALFPYFPSQPPRILFPHADLPGTLTALRRFNLFILGNYSIHSSVFPSAHVSSAFSAAWGLFYTIPHRKRFGCLMAIYAGCVSVATVYGRYHYAADVAAGVGMSLVALMVLKWVKY